MKLIISNVFDCCKGYVLRRCFEKLQGGFKDLGTYTPVPETFVRTIQIPFGRCTEEVYFNFMYFMFIIQIESFHS